MLNLTKKTSLKGLMELLLAGRIQPAFLHVHTDIREGGVIFILLNMIYN
jgi:hypothetical protein